MGDAIKAHGVVFVNSNKSVLFSRSLAFVAVLLLTALTVAAARALHIVLKAAQSSASTTVSRPSLSDYKDLPVYFEQNRGQTDPRVRFLSRGANYTCS